MGNVLSETKRQQVIALGRLGWPLRRIEQETGVRRETAGAYLKAAGIGVRPPRAWGRRAPAKPANEVTTGSDATMNRSFARRSIVPTEIERGARCQWLTCVSAFQLRVGLAALSQRV